VGTRLEVLPDFFKGTGPSRLHLVPVGARAHPPGVALEASEEWFDSSEVLIFCDASIGLVVPSCGLAVARVHG
jgi:hypothetical protein